MVDTIHLKMLVNGKVCELEELTSEQRSFGIEACDELKEKIEDSKDEFDIRGISDISGFGRTSGYEHGCQTMLQAGVDWLRNKKKVNLKVKTYKNIYGVLEPKSKDAKELSKVICKAVDNDCTGAMHQAVMGHLFFITNKGLEKWKEEVTNND